jgi:hypothetical protein
MAYIAVEAAACTVTCAAPVWVERTACEQQAAGVDREGREHGCRVTVVATKAAGQRPEGACRACRQDSGPVIEHAPPAGLAVTRTATTEAAMSSGSTTGNLTSSHGALMTPSTVSSPRWSRGTS